MEVAPVALTEADRMILASYARFAEGLAGYLGGGYEIVLHSLEDFERSVIKIINGNYTGRTEGAPVTDLALGMLARMGRDPGGTQHTVYFSSNRKGEPFRSTTIAIPGEGGRIIGLMCINFSMNTPLLALISDLAGEGEAREHRPETFSDSVDDLIALAVRQVRAEVEANPEIGATNRNKEMVRLLWTRGVFNYKDGVIRCAELLGISKNTVYMHLRALRGE